MFAWLLVLNFECAFIDEVASLSVLNTSDFVVLSWEILTLLDREVLRKVLPDLLTNCDDHFDALLHDEAPKSINRFWDRRLSCNHMANWLVVSWFDTGAVDVAEGLVNLTIEPDHRLSVRMNIAVDIEVSEVLNWRFVVIFVL